MTLICPVLNLISMFQNIYIKFNTGQINDRTCKGTLKFPWDSDNTFAIAFLFKTFNKRIDMVYKRRTSWYQSFCKIPFLQPVLCHEYNTLLTRVYLETILWKGQYMIIAVKQTTGIHCTISFLTIPNCTLKRSLLKNSFRRLL